ncbi:MAG: conjugal transfer protein TraF [Candidatus Heimdallarchaeota archaeon]|nr:conjugal transfer protein TraF [Candidatus Heimdallarchaeota archaeon]
MVKRTSYFLYLALSLIFLSISIQPSQSISTNIPFTNINMDADDVLNYEGVRIVLFFKPACPSCHNQIETLKELENNYTLSIIALNVDIEPTNTTLVELISSLSLSSNWTLGYATSQAISTFDLTVVPSQVILDDNSEIVTVTEGYFDYTSIEIKILDAINHRTENYSENPISDSSDLLIALFIIIGVGVGTIVVIFLIRLLRKSDKTSNLLIANEKLKMEEINKKERSN